MELQTGGKRAQDRLTDWQPLATGCVSVCVATGAASLLSPRHMAEVAPPATRGAITSQNQVFITLGILVGFLAGTPSEYGVHTVILFGTELEWWRIPLLIGAALAVVQVWTRIGIDTAKLR